MSVLINLAIFPTDKGESVSSYVASAVSIIKGSGLAYNFGPMGTVIEGEWDEVLSVVHRCFEELKKESNRIYMTISLDYRKDKTGRIKTKVKSIEEKL